MYAFTTFSAVLSPARSPSKAVLPSTSSGVGASFHSMLSGALRMAFCV